MSIDLNVLRSLVAAGVSAAQLLAAIEAMAAKVVGRQDRKRKADAERVREKRADLVDIAESHDVAPEVATEQESHGVAATRGDSSQNQVADGESRDVAPPSPAPLPSSSPPYPPNNYLPLTPIRSEPGGSVPARPIYTDSKHELWGEGVQILQQLGLAERSARSNIGRWLRDQRNDAQRVLGAIQRARDARVIDPIPWITRALTFEVIDGKQNSKSFSVAARRLSEQLGREAAELERREAAGMGCETPRSDDGLLPEG